MNLTELGCQTRTSNIHIPDIEPLIICSLLDRQQYSDPDGTAREIGISSALWPLSGLLWPSAYYLTIELSKISNTDFDNILEIGCGLALPSLVAHRNGCNITASDHNPVSAAFLRKNLELNKLDPSLMYLYGHWGSTPPQAYKTFAKSMLTEKYDLIVGSDLLYEPDSAPNLAAFINQHANSNSQIWIVDASRGYRGPFKRHMRKYNFKLLEEQPLNRRPCLSGADSYKGRLLKFSRA